MLPSEEGRGLPDGKLEERHLRLLQACPVSDLDLTESPNLPFIVENADFFSKHAVLGNVVKNSLESTADGVASEVWR
jgi:hypothetical protein